MAALIKHCPTGFSFLHKKNTILAGISGALQHNSIRHFNRFKKKNRKLPPIYKAKWESTESSLAARGFLRPLKAYTPPNDVSERLDRICESNNISMEDSTVIDGFDDRFKIFAACEKEFNCAVPNSLLHTIQTIGDLRVFYFTPINTTLPLDAAIKMDLPKNLHIQTQYLRFHPDTDTKFDGKTAFPKSSTLVSGIKYKKKYPSLILDSPFS